MTQGVGGWGSGPVNPPPWLLHHSVHRYNCKSSTDIILNKHTRIVGIHTNPLPVINKS